MGYMASVDIVFTEYKLSDAQKNAVVEILSGGFTTAKSNTVKSLANKGLIVTDDNGGFTLEENFHDAIKAAYAKPELREIEELLEPIGTFSEDLGSQEDYVLNDEKSVAEAIYGDPEESFGILMEDRIELHAEVFNKDWTLRERKLMGFEAVNGWKNVGVWDGLTAQEIRDDMDTARPTNRRARREFARVSRKLVKSLVAA